MESIFRKLPLFKGKERLAKSIFKGRLAANKDCWIKGKFGCRYLVPNIIESIGFEIFINGIYEQSTSDFIISRLPLNGVFLDLGANIGAISVPVHSKRKDVKIVCVEAAPWIYDYLKVNLEANKSDTVKAFNKALFYSDNEVVNFYSPVEKFGKGSLSPVFTDKIIPVVTLRVDTLIEELGIQHVDLLKIDVEGYEYHVFKGATEILGRPDAPDIIFEFVDWAEDSAKGAHIGSSQKILRGMGYRIFYFKDRGVMEEVTGILEKGFFMLFATKRAGR